MEESVKVGIQSQNVDQKSLTDLDDILMISEALEKVTHKIL